MPPALPPAREEVRREPALNATPTGLPDDTGWADEFTALCASHHGRLVRWLTTVFGPRDAEDIAQEVFLRAFRAASAIDTKRPLWPWLQAIARNVIAN